MSTPNRIVEISCHKCGGTGILTGMDHDGRCKGNCRYCPVPVPIPCNDCGGAGCFEVEETVD